jgi:hypothetical protein
MFVLKLFRSSKCVKTAFALRKYAEKVLPNNLPDNFSSLSDFRYGGGGVKFAKENGAVMTRDRVISRFSLKMFTIIVLYTIFSVLSSLIAGEEKSADYADFRG